MPELPDLAVFAVNLEKHFKNKTLESVQVIVPKKLNVSEATLQNALVGHQLQHVLREGKTLQLHFGGGNVLGLHLMLHGELQLVNNKDDLRFKILELNFKGGHGFALTDFQKQATPTLNPEAVSVPDALAKDFSITYFKQVLSKKSISIKQVLMDQKIVRGIGNTYADEILWHARISPFSVSKAIPEKKVMALYRAIEDTLRKEIVNLSEAIPEGFNTEVKDFLVIHHPKLEKSPTGYPIMNEKVGGRTTYYTAEQERFD